MGLYFGIKVDPEPWLHLLQRTPGFKDPAGWHVTILHIGDGEPKNAKRALRTVAKNATAFEMSIGPVFHLPQGHTCLAVDPAGPFKRLKARLYSQYHNQAMRNPQALPHVTLYNRRVELNMLAHGEFRIPIVTVPVTGISLLSSRQGHQKELDFQSFPRQGKLF